MESKPKMKRTLIGAETVREDESPADALVRLEAAIHENFKSGTVVVVAYEWRTA